MANKKGLQSLKPFAVATPLFNERCNYNALIDFGSIIKTNS
jgi:hypothetical protein